MAPVADRPIVAHELPPGLEIRVERSADHPSVSTVVAAAFGSPEEARLVEAVRASAEFVPELSLVADVDGEIVGHVMISHATIRDARAQHRVAVLAPLAVAPAFQCRGVGSVLVRRVTARADERGEPLVVLQGSPVFYGRLGFEYSVPYGIHMRLPAWAPAEASQVLRLRNYTASIRGQVVYPPAFDAVTEHTEQEGSARPGPH
jgi:putative acetyltransferase